MERMPWPRPRELRTGASLFSEQLGGASITAGDPTYLSGDLLHQCHVNTMELQSTGLQVGVLSVYLSFATKVGREGAGILPSRGNIYG